MDFIVHADVVNLYLGHVHPIERQAGYRLLAGIGKQPIIYRSFPVFIPLKAQRGG
jgi:hypothetical protein